jgi:predicted permease
MRVFRRRETERELDEELESHLELHIADNVRAGMTPDEARRQALIALGGVEQTRERHREARGAQWIDELRQHLRFAVRALVRNPGFTATVVTTLALGIGANAAVFAVTYGILMRPMPYSDPSRLVVMTVVRPGGDDLGFSPPSVPGWLDRFSAVGDSAAYNDRDVTVKSGGEGAVVSTAFVTDRFFRVLGVPALAGETTDFGARGGLVITSRLVERLLHIPASQAVGRSINVGENNYQVAAVISASVGFPAEANDAWVLTPALTSSSKVAPYFKILVRLKPGITLEQARYQFKGERSLGVTPVGEASRTEMAPVLRVSVAAGLLVLFVACANVATLFIGRNITQRREIAARLALGASPRQLARGFFMETLLLAAIASVAGVALAASFLRLFVQHAAGVFPRMLAVMLDAPVLASIVVLTAVVAITCGALPAWHAARADFQLFLRTTVLSTPAAWKLRGALVVSQIAFSIVLLIGAGLLTRSVRHLLSEDHGFAPSGVVAAKIVLSDSPLGGEDGGGFVRELLARVRALPGVTFAGLGNALPPSPRLITVAGQIIEKSEGIDETRFVKIGSATPDFLRALGAQFLSGRDFSDADGDVVVLNESAAKFLLRNRDPIGGYISSPARGLFKFAGKPSVIGVVRDIKYEGLDSPAGTTVYVPWDRRPMGTTYLVVRSSGDLAQLSATIRRIAREINPAIPVPEIQPLEHLMASSIANRRLRMFPAIGFATLALAVALMGLLATLSRAVAERRQELAIRAAVGASSRQLVWLILVKGLALTGLGVVAGLVVARMISQSLSHLLFRVTPYDPLTFAVVAALVGAGSIVAVFVAARRASSADPLAALRYE